MLLVLPFWLLTDLVVLVFGWRNAQREAKHTQREIDAIEAIAKTS